MAIDPIKIPQNVYIEDRIVGPLTLKQIMVVGIGGGLSYAMWASASKAYGTVGIVPTVIIWLPCVISVIFAFVKINDLSMLKICFLMIERMMKAPERVWAPRGGITVNIRTFSTVPEATRQKDAVKAAMSAKNATQLDAISTVLDTSMVGQDDPTIAEYNDPIGELASRQSSGEPEPPAPVFPVNKDKIVAEASHARSSIFRDLTAK